MNSISVIMATNKVDAYLDEAAQSVLATKNIEIELVLVLDGVSIPNRSSSWESDPRVTFVRVEKSNGLAAALNAGVIAARHEIIARLDSDDRNLPQRFAKQLNVLIGANPPVLVGSRSFLIDENGHRTGLTRNTCGADVRKIMLIQNVVPHSTYMLKKSDLVAVGGYNPDLKQMEDYDLLLRLGTRGKIAVICEPLIEYRVHRGQMSKAASWTANYIDAVVAGRQRLGEALGVPKIYIDFSNQIWRLVQMLRSAGWIRPWYQVRAKSI